MKPEKDIVIYLQEEPVRGLDMRLRPAETAITGKQPPPAKLPDACPHCGAAAMCKGHALSNIYNCGHTLIRRSDKEFPRVLHPCKSAKPAPEPAESQEDSRQRSEKARAENWVTGFNPGGDFTDLITKIEMGPGVTINSPNPQPTETNDFPDRCPDCGAAALTAETDSNLCIVYECGTWLGRRSTITAYGTFNSCKFTQSPNPKPEQNTMASTPVHQVLQNTGTPQWVSEQPQVQPLPAPGTKWAYETSNGIHVGVVKSAGLSGIYLDAGKTHGIYTPAEWNSLTRTQLPTKHDALRIPRRGPSRIKWFTVGAAACFFGRPFLPELWSIVAGYVSRLM